MSKKETTVHSQKEVNEVLDESLQALIREHKLYVSTEDDRIVWPIGSELKIIIEGAEKAEDSLKIQRLLRSLYVKESASKLISKEGYIWTKLYNLLQDEYQVWKMDNYKLYDDDTDFFNEELDRELDEMYYTFIKGANFEKYVDMILEKRRERGAK